MPGWPELAWLRVVPAHRQTALLLVRAKLLGRLEVLAWLRVARVPEWLVPVWLLARRVQWQGATRLAKSNRLEARRRAQQAALLRELRWWRAALLEARD